MLKLRTNTKVIILLLSILPVTLFADTVIWTSGDYEIGSGKEWFSITELNTRNDVTVTIYGGGGVSYFWMYDNSELTIHDDGSVAYLYLYDNASASFFGCSSMNELYIDPTNTGFVKLYAEFSDFLPLGPNNSIVFGTWLESQDPFSITLVGNGAYSHIQFVPEPASAAILALGSLFVCSRRKRC